ncbi:MAG: peptidoglycan-binding protein LysM, partial [Dokdonia donghaensis]|nr:peptidoglycan-binding protein LysM [Dokdonia donghaensis]
TVQTPFVFNPTPLTGKNYTGFKEALAFKESRGDYLTINRFGYLGKYQFGASTLDLLGIQDGSEFLENPVLQEQAFLLNASRNKWVLRRDIKRYEGRWISGVRVTESGILAAAHLAGPGSVKKFLRSGGATGFQDAFGTSIRSYMKRFSGYDVSNIEAIKKPSLQNLSASL